MDINHGSLLDPSTGSKAAIVKSLCNKFTSPWLTSTTAVLLIDFILKRPFKDFVVLHFQM